LLSTAAACNGLQECFGAGEKWLHQFIANLEQGCQDPEEMRAKTLERDAWIETLMEQASQAS